MNISKLFKECKRFAKLKVINQIYISWQGTLETRKDI